MLLDIEPAVFTAGERTSLIALLKMIAKERHEWHPTPQESLLVDDFVRELNLQQTILEEWAAKALEESANPRPRNGREQQVTAERLEETVEDLQKPAVLVVENRLGDGGFIRAVAEALRDERLSYALHPRRAWLKFCNGGGTGQMPKLTADECGEFAVVIRVAVLFDSDRTSHDVPSPNEQKAEEARRAGARHVHVLTWRMMENYVPFRVWEAVFPGKPGAVRQIRATIPRQRGYLHLKHTFVGRRGSMPSLWDRPLDLNEDDFHELGPDVVAELRQILTMIHEIL